MWLAHGVGTRTDLPVPVGPAATAAAATLVISFAVLGLLWKRPRPVSDGRPLPVEAVLDHPVLRMALQLVALLMTAAVTVIGFAGPPEISSNLAPWTFYIHFWVGMVPASLLLGPVVRVLNPLRLLHRGLTGLLRIDPDHGLRAPLSGASAGVSASALPPGVGYWPAAVSLVAFG